MKKILCLLLLSTVCYSFGMSSNNPRKEAQITTSDNALHQYDVARIILCSNMRTQEEKRWHVQASFLDSYIRLKCKLKIDDVTGERRIKFADLHCIGNHEMSFDAVNTLMIEARAQILDEFPTHIEPAWKKSLVYSFCMTEQEKYYALLYLYRQFADGYEFNVVPASQKKELIKARREYQIAMMAFDREKVGKIDVQTLHPHNCVSFLEHLIRMSSTGHRIDQSKKELGPK